jgi:hypothetical protein
MPAVPAGRPRELIVARTRRDSAVPKSVAVVAGIGVVMGLSMAAPGRAASPSIPASQIVGSRHHQKPETVKHRTTPRSGRDANR